MHRSWLDHLEFVACKRLAVIVQERSFGSELDAKRFFCWLLFFSAHFHDPTVDQTGRRRQLLCHSHANKISLVTFFLHPPLSLGRCVVRV